MSSELEIKKIGVSGNEEIEEVIQEFKSLLNKNVAVPVSAMNALVSIIRKSQVVSLKYFIIRESQVVFHSILNASALFKVRYLDGVGARASGCHI